MVQRWQTQELKMYKRSGASRIWKRETGLNNSDRNRCRGRSLAERPQRTSRGGHRRVHSMDRQSYEMPSGAATMTACFVLLFSSLVSAQDIPVAEVEVQVSEPTTLLKYDLEISGFGSAALGHLCLLDLENQTYPGSKGTKTEGWPTWTVPVMRWTKEQGGVTGYPHSALHVVPESSTNRLIELLDRDNDEQIDNAEAKRGLLPEPFPKIDTDGDGVLTKRELTQSNDRVSHVLPNVALPALNGGGAMEIFVSTSEGVCDFISAMDTARIPEWKSSSMVKSSPVRTLRPMERFTTCGSMSRSTGAAGSRCVSFHNFTRIQSRSSSTMNRYELLAAVRCGAQNLSVCCGRIDVASFTWTNNPPHVRPISAPSSIFSSVRTSVATMAPGCRQRNSKRIEFLTAFATRKPRNAPMNLEWPKFIQATTPASTAVTLASTSTIANDNARPVGQADSARFDRGGQLFVRSLRIDS